MGVHLCEITLKGCGEQISCSYMNGKFEEPLIKNIRAADIRKDSLKMATIGSNGGIIVSLIRFDEKTMEYYDKALLYGICHPDVHRIA